MTVERKQHIQNRVIQFQNDTTLPYELREKALEVDGVLNRYDSTYEMIEKAYQELQLEICSFYLQVA